LERTAVHSVRPTKAKPKVQTFGHELPRPFNLDGHSVKPPKAKSKVQTHGGATHFISCPKQPFNLTAKILSIFLFLY
jgi:hypothetical protein